MISRKDRKFSSAALLGKQRGGALILIAFMIGIMLTAFLIKNFSANSIKAEQDAKTMEALGQAKDGLISWAVSHSTAPGQMPWPDRRELTSPNYDGQSDCSNANYNLLNSASEPNFLGQIPTIASTTPCLVYPGVGNRFLDSSGNNLWYAVSRNLLRRYDPPATAPVINTGIIDNPTYPWMIVRDSGGTIVSDRVAVVIIAPGPALSGQNRAGDAPLPINFLDQVTIGGNTYANFDYAVDAEDFIMGDTTTGTINDRLVYITIDELMAALEKRAGENARFALISYRTANGYLPYAAQLGTTQHFSPEEDKLEGFLPVHYQACSYRREEFSILGIPVRQSLLSDCSASIFDPDLSGIASVSFTSPTGTFNNDQDSCIANNQVCTCTGAGNCTGPGAFRFQCSGTNCFSISIGNSDGWGTIGINNSKLTHRTGSCIQTSLPTLGCNNNDSQIACSGAAAGTFASSSDAPFASHLPSWMVTNEWYKHIYYYTNNRIGTEPLTAGTEENLDVVILTVGKAIDQPPFTSKGSAQNRLPSSCAIDDYLDSVENTNLDRVFDTVGTKRSNSYNDHIFIITP